jgi:hypothetical protein
MNRASSISVEELNKVAASAARSVLGDSLKRFGGGASIGFFPDIGTVGIIWRDPDFGQFNAADLFEVSEKLTSEMRSIAGDSRAVASIFKGGVTAGYFPVEPFLTQELF